MDSGRWMYVCRGYPLLPRFPSLGSRPQMGLPSIFPGVLKTSKYQTWSILNSKIYDSNTFTSKIVGSRSCLEVLDWGRLIKRLGTTALLGRFQRERGVRSNDWSIDCVDNIFALKILVEKYLEEDRKLFAAFMDFKRAYARVDRMGLWDTLEQCYSLIFAWEPLQLNTLIERAAATAS